jgi:opine dehydrogenase
MLRFAVLGAGAGGQSMAAILSEQGYPVKLYDIDREKIAALKSMKTITVSGKIEACGTPDLITDQLEEAVTDVDIIMVVTTTDAHAQLARDCAPYLHDGELFILTPGHCGGALEVAGILRGENGCGKDILIAETGDLLYACRCYEVGKPLHTGLKSSVKLSAFPASDTSRVMDVLGPVFPMLRAVDSVLETGFEGGGAMLHPLPTVMNINKMDLGEPYDYYMEGITPHVAEIIEACDKERVAVCKALGLDVLPEAEALVKMYKLEPKDSFYDLIQSIEPYKGLKNPTSTKHRFLVEDTMNGLVPLASVGKALGVKTPIMDAFITLASIICGRDFASEGRTAEKLGFAGKTAAEIREMVK